MLVCKLASVAASGTDVKVIEKNLLGHGPVRLYIKNTGSNAFGGCKVQLAAPITAPDGDHTTAPTVYASLDTATFASLTGGAVLQLLIAAPIDWLRVLVTCSSGTTLDIWITG